MTTERLRQAGRATRDSSASVILVLASVVSASAAVAGLTSWVSVAAAVAAVISGIQVLRTDLIVPMRVRSAENATQLVISRDSEQRRIRGTAFQIATNRWVTAHHVVARGDEILLRMKGGDASAQILWQNPDTDLAVLSVNSEWAWRASPTRSAPDFGDRIKIIGWTRAGDRPSLRLALDYLVQGQGEANLIALTGPDPQLGFSGGPAINMRSGRVVGIMTSFSRGREVAYPGGPEPVSVIFVTPISDIPEEYC